MKKLTTEEFIERARKAHGDRYDYSKVVYKNIRSKVEIICKKHGSFFQLASEHYIGGHGCQKCVSGKLQSLEEFIKKSKIKHGNKYDYSKVIYTSISDKIIIICPIHGDFIQTAGKHMVHGCDDCGGSRTLTNKEFIERSVKVHGEKYDYSLVEYKSYEHKVKIICSKHGVFYQRAGAHLIGKGCVSCKNNNVSKKETKWLDILNIDEYCRSSVVYINKKKFIVDAKVNNIIYEFLGDFWHGNPSIYKSGKNKILDRTYKSLFNRTVKRVRLFRKHGYKVVCIWESVFDRKYKKINE